MYYFIQGIGVFNVILMLPIISVAFAIESKIDSECPHQTIEEGVVEISSSRGGEPTREQELRLIVTSFSPLSKTLEKTHVCALVKSSFGVP